MLLGAGLPPPLPLLHRPCAAAAGWMRNLPFPGMRMRVAASSSPFDGDDASVRRNDAAATGPGAKPLPELNAEEAVRIQLDALLENNTPRQDHGLEVMYLFANAEGDFDGSLPCYFGSAADLYHFGHFALKFKTRFPELLKMESYEIVNASDGKVVASVRHGKRLTKWLFRMSKVTRGEISYWLTDGLVQLTEPQQ
ncbi:uncharacterized protein LOC9661228 isoform X1 [Selaginella moellendorffii]|uniref:uncharacterized protein LOC9661228 isoform X1 n=1 Tax=Selaginella moellendorffii TaxID=88036 RepID=UPI000D1C3502|nr:uncharacterized protein LOC9661228 isoform X1 [Selaginella moellendorffii]|eukprot:XP_024518359.1 uncharacterized protein LOC9661228 isoform X1 [Selaginella moellendorffii]